jgi:hypothetical protein
MIEVSNQIIVIDKGMLCVNIGSESKLLSTGVLQLRNAQSNYMNRTTI